MRVVRPRVRRPSFPAERQPRLLPFRRFEIRRENATVRARIRRGGRRLRPRARPSVRRGVVPASVERPLRRAFALSVGFVHLPPRALHLGDETRQLPPLARQTRRGEIALSRQDGSLSCRSPDRVRLRRARRAGSCGLLDLNLRERLGRAGVLRPRVVAARRRRRSKRRKLLRLFFFFFPHKGCFCFNLEVLLLVQRVQLPLHVLHAPRELADGRLRAVPARQDLRECLLRAARALVPPRRRILLIRHPRDSHPGSRSTRGTRRARHRPPRRRPRSPRRPSRAPRRRVPRTPRGHAPGAHPRKRPRGGAARSCRRPRRRRRSLRGVRGAWWRVSDARARVDAREPCVKGNGRDASPSRRFDGSRAPSTERPIRHSVVAEKSTRAAPSGETTTSDATAVGSARARETYRQARSRPPPSRPRSLRRRTPRGAVTRRPRRRELSSETLAV